MSNHWILAPDKSPIWIADWEKPSEHIYQVRDEPERPAGLETKVCWISSCWPEAPEEPEMTLYLGALEWSWSPMHSRLDSYYLSKTDHFWLIYLHVLEDGGEEWTWNWSLYAFAERFECADLLAVGYWMIHDVLETEADSENLDCFHYVSGEGALSVGHFRMIGDHIW